MTIQRYHFTVPVQSSKRGTVRPKCNLKVTNAKIAGIDGELKNLQLAKHVHAIGVLLRVFLEMSVDDYLENKAGSLLTFTEPNSGRTIDKKLKDKVKETIAHMVANGAAEKDFKGVLTAMNDQLNPFSIDSRSMARGRWVMHEQVQKQCIRRFEVGERTEARRRPTPWVTSHSYSSCKPQAVSSALRTSGHRSSERLHSKDPKRSRWPNEM
jgi:hypothetical protein